MLAIKSKKSLKIITLIVIAIFVAFRVVILINEVTLENFESQFTNIISDSKSSFKSSTVEFSKNENKRQYIGIALYETDMTLDEFIRNFPEGSVKKLYPWMGSKLLFHYVETTTDELKSRYLTESSHLESDERVIAVYVQGSY